MAVFLILCLPLRLNSEQFAVMVTPTAQTPPSRPLLLPCVFFFLLLLIMHNECLTRPLPWSTPTPSSCSPLSRPLQLVAFGHLQVSCLWRVVTLLFSTRLSLDELLCGGAQLRRCIVRAHMATAERRGGGYIMNPSSGEVISPQSCHRRACTPLSTCVRAFISHKSIEC